jgi:predicted ATP-dependent serine protease
MIEIQALVSTTWFMVHATGTTSLQHQRLKHDFGSVQKNAPDFRLGNKDVFLNVTGGISS